VSEDDIPQYQGRNWLKKLVSDSRYRAKRLGIECDLTYENVLPLVPDYCPVLGIKLEWKSKKGGNPNKPSIDRIDPNKGYTLDNIVVVSWRANDIKSDATPEELMKLAIFYSRYSGSSKNSW